MYYYKFIHTKGGVLMDKLPEAAERQFNELVQLAKENPKKFELRRQELIKEFLDSQNDPDRKRRLTGMQWKIDQERMRFKGDPLHFASYVFGLMWGHVKVLNVVVQGLRTYVGVVHAHTQTLQAKSRISVLSEKKNDH